MFSKLGSSLLLAQANNGSTDLGAALKLSPGGTSVRDIYRTPADLFNVIVPLLFVLAGIIIFGLLIYSGFLFIQNDTKGKDEAKTVLETAAKGFGMMFVAYWIVQILEIILGMNLL